MVALQGGSECARVTPAHASARPTTTPQLLGPAAYSVIIPRRALDMDTVMHWVNASARRGGAARLAPMLQGATPTRPRQIAALMVNARWLVAEPHVHVMVDGVAAVARTARVLLVRERPYVHTIPIVAL
jgi:hypothetical protein